MGTDASFAEEPRILAYRVRDHAERLRVLDDWRRNVDQKRAAEEVVVANIAASVEELADTVNGLRKVLVGFALSIALSSVVFALSVLAATGTI